MMACPKGYKDSIAAKMAAARIHSKSKGKQEPRAYYCNMCKQWHLKDGK